MTETQTKPEPTDAERTANEGVLAGVLREPTETKPPVPARRGRRAAPETKTAVKPATRTRKAPATPETKTGKAPAKAPAKTTRKPAAAKPEANGGTSAREVNQVLARELIDLVAGHFKGHSKADQEKIANWLKVLPTGGAAWQRYWPKGFARPTTSDWRKPE